jgi:hypothetical protein
MGAAWHMVMHLINYLVIDRARNRAWEMGSMATVNWLTLIKCIAIFRRVRPPGLARVLQPDFGEGAKACA